MFRIIAIISVAASFLLNISANNFFALSTNKAYAVDPPSYKQRQAVERRRRERKGEIFFDANKKNNSNCEYGIDKKTGKCYIPKEGQIYTDPKTGKTKMKKTKKWNLPWNNN